MDHIYTKMERKHEFSSDATSAKIGKEILPLHVEDLPEFFQKKGEEEINYTSSVRERTLKEIKEKILKDATIDITRLNNELLLMFLAARKYDVNKAFLQFKKYVAFKRKNYDIFTNYTFDVLLPFFTSEFLSILPYRCEDGCTIITVQLEKYYPAENSVEAIKKLYTLVLVQCLREPMTQINGFKVIIDMNCNIEFLKICTPHTIYLLYYGTQVVLPGRFKGIYLMNMGVMGRGIWQMMRVFLSEKLKKRIFMHKNNDTLVDFFPKSILPKAFGGDLKDYDKTEWLKEMFTPENLDFMDTFKD